MVSISANMICYEGTGTPVDVIVKNTKEDLLKKTDSVILKALEIKPKNNVSQ